MAIHINGIAVASPKLFLAYHPRGLKVVENPLHRPLSNLNLRSNIAYPGLGVMHQANKNMTMI
jgi:hypothetical protein